MVLMKQIISKFTFTERNNICEIRRKKIKAITCSIFYQTIIIFKLKQFFIVKQTMLSIQ